MSSQVDWLSIWDCNAQANSKIDAGNEELRVQIKTLRYELETVKQERDVVNLRHEKELRDVQVKAEAYLKSAHVCQNSIRFIVPKLIRNLHRHLRRAGPS